MKAKGFALIEVLIAITILSIVLLSVFSGVFTTINAMTDQKNLTKALFVARNKMNEFIIERMRGLDVNRELVEEYEGYYFSRETTRFEHELIGPLPAKKTIITVHWKEGERDREYSVSYIYPENL